MSSRTNTAKWDDKRKVWRIVVQREGVVKNFTSSKPGRTGQREANKKADDWLDGVLPDKRLKVKEAYEKYKQDQLGRRSTVTDKDIVSKGDNWILPYIGTRYLDRLTLGDLQEILDNADRQGKSRKTIRNIRGRLSHFFRYCRQHGWTQLRTDDLTVSEHAPVKQKQILQKDALYVLFTSSVTTLRGRKVQDDYINAYRLQVLCGLRPGELLGLKWSDISDGIIHLQRSINYYGEVTSGKNDNAVRPIVLNGLMREILHDQQLLTNGQEYVFANIATEQTYLKRWHRYCETNELPRMTVYELRHTFVSISASVLSEGAVKSLVGHSQNMDTFGIYGHDVQGDGEKAAQALEERFAQLIRKTC